MQDGEFYVRWGSSRAFDHETIPVHFEFRHSRNCKAGHKIVSNLFSKKNI